MKPLLGCIEVETGNFNDYEKCFSLDEIKNKFEVTELIEGRAWFILNKLTEYSLEFALVQFVYSHADDTHIYVSRVFEGNGMSGDLRECRHTYWGEDNDGYIFYPSSEVIIKGLEKLKEYFDMT